MRAALRASKIAFATCGLYVFCFWMYRTRPRYFAAALAAWTLVAIFRLLTVLWKQRATPWTDPQKRTVFHYWLGALASCVVAPILGAVAIALIMSTWSELP